MNFKILLLITAFIFNISLSAQTDTTKAVDDTTDVENWESWEDDDDFKFEFNVFGDEFRGAPTVYLSYGLAEINSTGIGYEFADPRSLELKLGKTYQQDYKYDSRILKYRLSFLFLNSVTTALSSDTRGNLKSESYRFGTGRATGYGYKLGSAAVIPYNLNSFTWTRFDADESLVTIDGLTPAIDRYNNSIRFGNTTEAGIKFHLIQNIALDASYERTTVYERHLFWKWGGSFLIEVISQSLLDEFIEEITESSPLAGPIVNFVLKNGLSYGMYELRKEKMNWPFNSAPALMFDQFKAGITFVF